MTTRRGRRRLGSPVRLREEARDAWVFTTVETSARDVRHALRLLRRDPAFTFTALATLALGIGLTTTIFSAAYGVLWRPLPYPHPDRLVVLSSAQQSEKGPRTLWNWSPVSYEGLRRHVTALEHLAAYNGIDVLAHCRKRTSSCPIAGPTTMGRTRSCSWSAACGLTQRGQGWMRS